MLCLRSVISYCYPALTSKVRTYLTGTFLKFVCCLQVSFSYSFISGPDINPSFAHSALLSLLKKSNGGCHTCNPAMLSCNQACFEKHGNRLAP